MMTMTPLLRMTALWQNRQHLTVGSGSGGLLKGGHQTSSIINSITSPTVAGKLKALEEDVEFHYSILKDARHRLNAELANITQQLRPESKCSASARNEVLENLAVYRCNRVYCIHVPGHDPVTFSFWSFSFLIRWGFYGPNYLRC